MWTAANIAQHRERVVSPLCKKCKTTPCCDFNEDDPIRGEYVLFLTPVEAQTLGEEYMRLKGEQLKVAFNTQTGVWAGPHNPIQLGMFVLNQKGPCPFLEDGRCGCYNVRPIECRMFPLFDIREPYPDISGPPAIIVADETTCPAMTDEFRSMVAKQIERKFRVSLVMFKSDDRNYYLVRDKDAGYYGARPGLQKVQRNRG